MRTAALASNAAQPDLTVFAPMFALPRLSIFFAMTLRLGRDLPTSARLFRAKPAVAAMAGQKKNATSPTSGSIFLPPVVIA
jgi:hypothetical protein